MQEPDALLIARAQHGDRAALDELLRLGQQPLFRYLAAMLANPAAAEDVLQETLFRAARKLRWLSDARAFRAWLFRIASREAYRYLRRHRREETLDSLPEEALTAPAVQPFEVTDDLRAAVLALSPASRAVMTLHYWDELSLEEVALALEVPLGTVKSRLAYGLKQLRDALVPQ